MLCSVPVTQRCACPTKPGFCPLLCSRPTVLRASLVRIQKAVCAPALFRSGSPLARLRSTEPWRSARLVRYPLQNKTTTTPKNDAWARWLLFLFFGFSFGGVAKRRRVLNVHRNPWQLSYRNCIMNFLSCQELFRQ